MSTGKIKNNYKFYKGFEDEPEIEFFTIDREMTTLHIWEGYFGDIFDNAPLHGLGWHGFTRDYQQLEGAFAFGADATVITNLKEYYDDLKYYKNTDFELDNTKKVYELLCSWFEEVMEKGYKEIVVQVW